MTNATKYVTILKIFKPLTNFVCQRAVIRSILMIRVPLFLFILLAFIVVINVVLYRNIGIVNLKQCIGL